MRLKGKRLQAAVRDSRFVTYLNTTRKLGVAMLSFLLIYSCYTFFRSPIYTLIYFGMGEVAGRILGQLFDMLFYILSFMLPVLVYRWMTPRRTRIPMPLAPTVFPKIGLVIPAAIAVIFCAAQLNAVLLDFLGVTATSTYPTPDPSIPPDQAVLWSMAVALVPAFCEEFLFRGLVLPQLLPYGKTVAVIGSALLFGLMHANPAQMLYATVAGIVLGLVAIESGSIWAGVLIHLFNNLLSVTDEILWNRLQYPTGFYLQKLIELTMVACGLVCLALLLRRREREDEKQRAAKLRVGADLPCGAIRGFFTLPMIAFWGISLLEMVLVVCLNLI